MLRRLGTRTASVWLDEVLKSGPPVNPLMEDYLDAAMRLSAFPDQPITLFDATLAAIASRLTMAIWTYDHHFDLMRANVWRQP